MAAVPAMLVAVPDLSAALLAKPARYVCRTLEQTLLGRTGRLCRRRGLRSGVTQADSWVRPFWKADPGRGYMLGRLHETVAAGAACHVTGWHLSPALWAYPCSDGAKAQHPEEHTEMPRKIYQERRSSPCDKQNERDGANHYAASQRQRRADDAKRPRDLGSVHRPSPSLGGFVRCPPALSYAGPSHLHRGPMGRLQSLTRKGVKDCKRGAASLRGRRGARHPRPGRRKDG
jgi:hypothetical protein